MFQDSLLRKFIQSQGEHCQIGILTNIANKRITEYCVGIIIPCMPPAAKASKYASAHVSSYFGTRLSSFRRTKLSDESINQGRELPELRGKGPFVHVERDASYKDTIDRMLTEISPADLQREGGACERV